MSLNIIWFEGFDFCKKLEFTKRRTDNMQVMKTCSEYAPDDCLNIEKEFLVAAARFNFVILPNHGRLQHFGLCPPGLNN